MQHNKKLLKIIRIQKRFIKIMSMLYIIVFFCFVFIFNEIYFFKNNNILNNIYFDKGSNFTSEEKKECIDLVNNIKTEYLEQTRTITFTKDIRKLNTEKQMLESRHVVGLNQFRVITIYYDKKYDIESIMCHELFHNIIKTNLDEFFAYDLMDYKSCLKNK